MKNRIINERLASCMTSLSLSLSLVNIQMDTQTDFHLSRPQITLQNMNPGSKLPLTSFAEMWYQIFLWALFSSMFIHTIAGAYCFDTLRKHKYGKYFPLVIIIMGVLLPLTSGVVSSAAVAFVYRASSYQMPPLYALLWGIGQTVVTVCVGLTRILATL